MADNRQLRGDSLQEHVAARNSRKNCQQLGQVSTLASFSFRVTQFPQESNLTSKPSLSIRAIPHSVT